MNDKTMTDKVNIKINQKIKTFAMTILLGIACIGTIYFIFYDEINGEKERIALGYNSELPDGKAQKTLQTKQQADEAERISQQQREKTKKLQDDITETNLSTSHVSAKTEQKTASDHAVQAHQNYQTVTSQLSYFRETQRPNAEVEELKKQVAELQEKIDNKQPTQTEDNTLELIEQSYQLAAKYFPKNGDQAQEPTAVPTEHKQNVRRIGNDGVSSLGGATAQPQNGFFTAYGTQPNQLPRNAVRACISGNQIVTTGARVKLRLLEAMQAGGVLIPGNSEVYGTARIEGQRLNIVISHIESGGNIVSVEMNAHDIDGQKGLFVPNTIERTAMKDAAGSIASGFGSSLSFSTDAKQQIAMDVTRGILSGGSQYLATKLREVKVRIKTNYQILLISKNNEK